jgi:alkylated DNA repair protein (DNA oxidative demethylase)
LPEIDIQIPPGLKYYPEVLSSDEENDLVELLQRMPFSEVRMHGVAARRRVRHFGWVYGYQTWQVEPGPPVPESLLPIRAKAAALANLDSERFEEVLVTKYPPGAGIGWHRDAPMFGPLVMGISLLSSCRFRFRRQPNTPILELTLDPRSVYLLGGSARSQWQHSIPLMQLLRYSITFRTLRPRQSGSQGRQHADRVAGENEDAGSAVGTTRERSSSGAEWPPPRFEKRNRPTR